MDGGNFPNANTTNNTNNLSQQGRSLQQSQQQQPLHHALQQQQQQQHLLQQQQQHNHTNSLDNIMNMNMNANNVNVNVNVNMGMNFNQNVNFTPNVNANNINSNNMNANNINPNSMNSNMGMQIGMPSAASSNMGMSFNTTNTNTNSNTGVGMPINMDINMPMSMPANIANHNNNANSDDEIMDIPGIDLINPPNDSATDDMMTMADMSPLQQNQHKQGQDAKLPVRRQELFPQQEDVRKSATKEKSPKSSKVLPGSSTPKLIPFHPAPNDVISTKLRTWNTKHPGNVYYTRLIQSASQELESDQPAAIREIAETVVEQICFQRGGRFLKLKDGERVSTMCTIMPRKTCISKVMHALRTAKFGRSPSNPTASPNHASAKKKRPQKQQQQQQLSFIQHADGAAPFSPRSQATFLAANKAPKANVHPSSSSSETDTFAKSGIMPEVLALSKPGSKRTNKGSIYASASPKNSANKKLDFAATEHSALVVPALPQLSVRINPNFQNRKPCYLYACKWKWAKKDHPNGCLPPVPDSLKGDFADPEYLHYALQCMVLVCNTTEQYDDPEHAYFVLDEPVPGYEVRKEEEQVEEPATQTSEPPNNENVELTATNVTGNTAKSQSTAEAEIPKATAPPPAMTIPPAAVTATVVNAAPASTKTPPITPDAPVTNASKAKAATKMETQSTVGVPLNQETPRHAQIRRLLQFRYAGAARAKMAAVTFTKEMLGMWDNVATLQQTFVADPQQAPACTLASISKSGGRSVSSSATNNRRKSVGDKKGSTKKRAPPKSSPKMVSETSTLGAASSTKLRRLSVTTNPGKIRGDNDSENNDDDNSKNDPDLEDGTDNISDGDNTGAADDDDDDDDPDDSTNYRRSEDEADEDDDDDVVDMVVDDEEKPGVSLDNANDSDEPVVTISRSGRRSIQKKPMSWDKSSIKSTRSTTGTNTTTTLATTGRHSAGKTTQPIPRSKRSRTSYTNGDDDGEDDEFDIDTVFQDENSTA